jgi:DNA-binding SARP family transcriptional activator
MLPEPCRIEMFGGLSVRLNGRTIDRFRTRKAASLLARLALFPDRAHPREELIDLLWPESEIEAGRANLRQSLWFLRHLLEGNSDSESVILADNTSLRLRPGSIVTDVGEFEAALNAPTTDDPAAIKARANAVELYHGELVNGLYDEWIFPERRRLESLYLGALHEQLCALAQAGDPARAIPFALRAIQVDPSNEDSHVAAIRLYAALGDPSSVRRQIEELTHNLKNELDEAPSSATLQAAESLFEEARVNESAQLLQNPINLSNLRGGSSFSPMPFWRRAPAVLAACACLSLFVVIPGLRSQRSHASDTAIVLPDDAKFAELRTLRTQGFITGTGEQRIAARRRHAQICIALGEKAWKCWYGRDEEKWLKRFTEANEDLRTALHWLLDTEPEKAVQLSGTLTRFWYVRNFPREGYRWLSESLARATRSRTTARARALIGCALLSTVYDAKAEAQCREALSICIERGDKWGEAHAHRHLGFLAANRGAFVTAKRNYERALELFTELGDDRGMAVTFLCLSFLSPDTREAYHSVRRKYVELSLSLFKKLENPWGISMALHSMGFLESDPARANALFQQAIATYPEANGLSEKENEERAMMALRRNDYAAARRYFLRQMEIARDRSNRIGVSLALGTLISIPDLEPTHAARLYGAEQTLNEKLGIDMGHRLDYVRSRIIARIGKTRYDASEREGRNLTWEQAVDEAARLN